MNNRNDRQIKVVGVSLGSNWRDFKIELDLGGWQFLVARHGMDGDIELASQALKSLDGKVDAIGLGGINIYLSDGCHRYRLRQGKMLAALPRRTPLADGYRLKGSYELAVVENIVEKGELDFAGKKILLVSGLDRFGLLEGLVRAGARVVLADPLFSLGLPLVFTSQTFWRAVCYVTVPLLSQLPINYLYPSGVGQEQSLVRKGFGLSSWLVRRLFTQTDVVAGDLHFIKKYLPAKLSGKVVLTSTLTRKDTELLHICGVKKVVTLYPYWQGRAFGANMVEAMACACLGKEPEEIAAEELSGVLTELGVGPSSLNLN